MNGNGQYSIDELYKSYGRRIFHVVLGIVENRHDAEEVVQETFLAVHLNLQNFEGRSSIYTWIYRIAVNNSLKYKKNRGRIVERSLDEELADLPRLPGDRFCSNVSLVEADAILNELETTVRRDLDHFLRKRLTEEQRSVFLLREGMDFSYKRISSLLKVSEPVVKARLNRARGKLKKYFLSDGQNTAPGRENPAENREEQVLWYLAVIERIKKTSDPLERVKI